MQARELSSYLLCLLALGAGLWAVSSLAPAQVASSSSSVGPQWPPKGEDIFTLDSRTVSPTNPQVQIPALTNFPVVTVPNGKWLVITDFEIQGQIDIVQDLAGVLTIRRGSQWTSYHQPQGIDAYHSAVGIAFAPGSRLTLRNYDTSGPHNVTFYFSGYYSR